MINASQSTSFSSRQDIVIKAAALLLLICVHRQTQFICNAFTTTPVVVTSTPTAFSHIQQLHSSDNTVATASDLYISRVTTTLWSSFYGKFEDFDLNEDGNDEDDDDDDVDDDDDDDDDEYEKMDD